MDTVLERKEAVEDIEAGTLDVRVKQVRYEGKGINSYEFTSPTGKTLPRFDAGSHIDIHLKNGVIRQYSLCNSPSERNRYVIAVLKDEGGRGGSRAVHESIGAGDIVTISKPRNHFALAAGAKKVILIAGGIGVTPLKAMAHELEGRGVDFEMHYCARSQDAAAFGPEFESMLNAGKLHYHFDDGAESNRLDLRALLFAQVAKDRAEHAHRSTRSTGKSWSAHAGARSTGAARWRSRVAWCRLSLGVLGHGRNNCRGGDRNQPSRK